jgi:septal ring factor EnvC (AmiA/AmiB activator)
MEQTYQTKSELRRSNQYVRTRSGRAPLWVKIMSLAVIWGAVALGCYFLAQTYISDILGKLDAIAANNAAQIDQLNAKLTDLQNAMTAHQASVEQLQEQFLAVEAELAAVKEEMSLAGSSLSTAAETKQALNDRIDLLGKELTELRKLIKQLEEAARVY